MQSWLKFLLQKLALAALAFLKERWYSSVCFQFDCYRAEIKMKRSVRLFSEM